MGLIGLRLTVNFFSLRLKEILKSSFLTIKHIKPIN